MDAKAFTHYIYTDVYANKTKAPCQIINFKSKADRAKANSQYAPRISLLVNLPQVCMQEDSKSNQVISKGRIFEHKANNKLRYLEIAN